MPKLILIPARFASSRFPGKPLALINGKPMIIHVLDNMLPLVSRQQATLAVVTDDQRIEDMVEQFHPGHVVRVNDDVASGSERIAVAYERFFKDKNYQFIVNVQGDEPLLTALAIEQILQFHQSHPQYEIATAVRKVEGLGHRLHPNTIKVAYCETTGRCLYFSRSSIPYGLTDESFWWQHLGIYCYKPQALLDFCQLPKSSLEQSERLEQLRALEFDMNIGATELINQEIIGVDSPEDVTRVEEIMGAQKSQ